MFVTSDIPIPPSVKVPVIIHLVIFYYIWVRILLSAVANGVVKAMQELKPPGDRSAVRELMKIVDL